MLAKVQKWGNSLAVRLPKALADEVAVQLDTPVEISVRDHEIIVRPIVGKYRLDELLSQIKVDNLHGETLVEGPVGREIW
ncbi:MAG: AbrB/MazE/SpoVT family DNA-binding domain-containing protein [Desulfuromonadales bacterium]